MYLRYFYDEKLAHASYLIGCQASGEALVVDPARNIEPYIYAAEREGLRISSVTETHIHADFVSGTRELVERTGATAYLSDEGDSDWKYTFARDIGAVLIRDGATWPVGRVRLQAMHTPGHTPEHLSFLLTDGATTDQPMGAFTGDFVFVGDVGRPDLLEEAAGFTGSAEPAARVLYQSLQRFADLPDYLQIWPGHGAGSACGKALGAVPSSTVGYEKRFSWAFRTQDEDEFVAQILADQPEPPRYFAMMKKLNKIGPPLLRTVEMPALLGSHRLAELIQAGAIIVDTRPISAFGSGHLPGSWHIPLDSSFVTYAGSLFDYDTPFYLIVGEGQLVEAVRHLHSIGLDNIAGYALPEALDIWKQESGRPLAALASTTPSQIAPSVSSGAVRVLDVRGAAEYKLGHLPNALNVPLGFLPERYGDMPTDRPLLLNCETGTRSSIAASLLQANGFANVVNLGGGYRDWVDAGLPVEPENGG